MASRKKIHFRTICIVLSLITFTGAIFAHYLYGPWGFYRKVSPEEAALRMEYVHTAEAYLGCNEADGSHKTIVDIYNAHEPLAAGYTVRYSDSWCAAFVSAIAIECGLTDIIPTECGCERQIHLLQEQNSWLEQDNAIPQPGDLIYYDWNMTEAGECTGWADHVGIVVGTKWPFVKVIEGNYEDRVAYRCLLLGHKQIRGYGKPDYSAYVNENTP